jgi:hypothetical protein
MTARRRRLLVAGAVASRQRQAWHSDLLPTALIAPSSEGSLAAELEFRPTWSDLSVPAVLGVVPPAADAAAARHGLPDTRTQSG